MIALHPYMLCIYFSERFVWNRIHLNILPGVITYYLDFKQSLNV